VAEVAAIDLDLAYSADPDLAPELLAAAGSWCAAADAEAAWHQLLAGWLQQLQAELPVKLQAPAYSLGLSLVADAEIAELNTDWRAKAGPTDVLAFAAQDEDLLDDVMPGDGLPPMPMPVADGALELGDIVISLETAARQAPEHDHSLEQELLFLASHGLLHLLGWDHPDQASLTAMLQRQERLCSSVNVKVSGSNTGL
jgi:probable rRNA maturation factor